MRRPIEPQNLSSADAPVPRFRRRRIVDLTSALVVAGLVAGAVAAVAQLQNNVTTLPLRPEPSAGSETQAPELETGAKNILLLGSDRRALESNDFGDDDGTQRADAMVLAHISL